jgi:formylglycine-generating enzyme required for sulfatase activity
VKGALSFAIGLCLSPAFLAAQPPRRDLGLDPIRVQKKLALIVGNQSYPKSPLKNPLNDAAAMAKALRGLGFDEVVEKTDLTMRQMRVEIDRFSASLHPGDLALFYYSGHGVQANEQNYLIPVDFAGTSEADLPYDAYPAAQVRDKLEQSGARLRILILDACRNNPFRSKRDGVRGLSAMASYVEGTYIAYATADNGVADDNPAEGNGLFTKLLLTALRTPGLDLKQIFEKTKQDVYVASQKTQRPFTYDGVIGQFYFTAPVTVVVNSPAVSSSDLAAQEEIAFWNGVDKSDAESLQLYLKRYGTGRYAALAQRYLAKMEPSSASVPAGPPAGGVATGSELKPGAVKTNIQDGLTYVWVPLGTFQMGCSPGDGECFDNEKPAHRATITKGFWMGQTEVTQQAYQKVTGRNPSYFKGTTRPVGNVTWDEAQSYCQAVEMRLPTEAEWEYAARAGSTGSRYGELERIAWHIDNSGNQTHEVGVKLANPWGLQDMLGNVSEWVADWYVDRYAVDNTTDPQGPASGTYRTLRGSWGFGPRSARASYRSGNAAGNRGDGVGFRCVGN